MPPMCITLRNDQHTRLLEHYGCSTQCRIYRYQPSGGYKTYISNRVAGDGMMETLDAQRVHADVYPVSYAVSHSHSLQNSHFSPFPLVLNYPFEFSRPILCPLEYVSCDKDLAVAHLNYACVHVRDPFLTWTEVSDSIARRHRIPERYLFPNPQAYPYDISYFYRICDAFYLDDGVLYHKESQLMVETGLRELERILDVTCIESANPNWLLDVEDDEALFTVQGLLEKWHIDTEMRVDAWRQDRRQLRIAEQMEALRQAASGTHA